MRWREVALIAGGVLGVMGSQVVHVGCLCPPEPPMPGYPCDPSLGRDACHEAHFCCSDDPAARGGALPGYIGKDIDGDEPLFSGINNAYSRSGMCLRTEDIPAGAGLLEPGAENCPVPCNSTWTQEEIWEVCGYNASCCQTVELEEADCVLDNDLGRYRPARGNDILELGDPWDEGAHATHQDPGLQGCAELALGDQAALEDCYRQLSVADQRGFCMFLNTGMGEDCEFGKENYRSPCDWLNIWEGREECVE